MACAKANREFYYVLNLSTLYFVVVQALKPAVYLSKTFQRELYLQAAVPPTEQHIWRLFIG